MINDHFLPHFIVKEGIHGVGVFAARDFKKGEILFKLTGKILSTPTRTSVQIGKNKHVENELAGYVNHHCTPNATAKVSRKTQAFISCKDIKKEDEITFDYNKNEDQLASPFQCECCGRMILGRKLKSRDTTPVSL